MNLFCFSFRGAAWKSGAEEGPVVAPGSPRGLSTLRSVYMCVGGGRCCAPSQDSLCLLLSSPISLTKHQKLFPTVRTQMSQAHSQWATLNPPSSPSISSI